MAKKSKLSESPWAMTKREFQKFIPITEANRENAKKIGRIFYLINVNGKSITYRGFVVLDPCFTKGKWKVNHAPFQKSVPDPLFDVYFSSDMIRQDWVSFWKKFLDDNIKQRELFILPTDPLIQYYKQ